MKNKALPLLLGIAAIIASVGILIWAISASKQTTISKVNELTNVDNAMPTGSIYHGKCGKNLIWTLDTGTGSLIIAGNGAMYDYDYSSSEPWYAHRDSIKRVALSEGVTTIGYNAFCDCENITSISIPNSVKKINGWAFMRCDSLKNITIPRSVTYIGDRVFAYTKLKSITLPERVTSIEEGLFNTCTSLASISIPNSIKSIGNNTFQYCTSLKNITIPYSVTKIGAGAFSNCNGLTSVVIPNSVTSIGNSAFFFCENLTSIVIPNSVTHIGENLFRGCHKLTVYTASSVDLSKTSIPAERVVKITPEDAIERYLKENPDQEKYVQRQEQERQKKVQQQQPQQQKKVKSKGHLKYNGVEICGKRSDFDEKLRKNGIIKSHSSVEKNKSRHSRMVDNDPFYDNLSLGICRIAVFTHGTPKSDQAYAVEEVISANNKVSWTNIKKAYNAIKGKLIAEYGQPTEVNEYFNSPYSEKESQMQAFLDGKAKYNCIIENDLGVVGVELDVEEIHNQYAIDYDDLNTRKWTLTIVYMDIDGLTISEREE